MKRRTCTFMIAIILSSMAVIPAYAQTVFTPPRGDLNVFAIYLRQASRQIMALTQTQFAQTPEASEAQMRDTAMRLNVAPAMLPVLDNVAKQMAAEMAALESEAVSYIDTMRARSQEPTKDRLLAFSERRRNLLLSARDRVRKSLGQADWQRLSAFIDNEFRHRVKRRGVWMRP